GKRFRIYYMAQVDVQPPKFILFVNYPNLMTETYKKYLYNQFRETYAFTGVPITLHLKGKEKKERPSHPLQEARSQMTKQEESEDDFADELEDEEADYRFENEEE